MLVEGKIQVKASIMLRHRVVGMVQSRLNWTKTDLANNLEVKKERE